MHSPLGRFRIKLIISFAGVVAIVCFVSGLFACRYASDFTLNNIRDNLIEIAQIASSGVDADELLSIPLDASGAHTPAYKHIEEALSLVQSKAPSIKYIYIFRKDRVKQGVLRFVLDVDIGTEDAGNTAQPGDEYDASNFPQLLKGFTRPSADTSVTSDNWGQFLSGYAPIRDKDGNCVAVLGVDMKAEDIHRAESGVKRHLLLSLVFGIILSLIFAYFLSGGMSCKVTALKKGFQRVAAGDLEYSVKVRGNDELSDLAVYFNKMSVDLKQHIAKLQKTTSDKERLLSELNIAKKIQQSFLPDSMPEIPGADISAMTIPAMTVGGDFYDFIPIDDNRVGIVIADVSGKGVPAALFVALSRAIIRSNASLFDSPHMMIEHANLRMIELSRSTMFETLFYAVLDTRRMTFSYANAGHNPPIVLTAPLLEASLLKAQAMPIGIRPGIVIGTETRSVCRQDMIVLYTDGVTETRNLKDEEYGTIRLMKILRDNASMASSEIIDKIKEDLKTFSQGKQQHDDMTLIVIKIL
ncbi:MAG: SpoIIE family protein phosphatase [Candidatus Omnitrophica bacterium]|nr:SpoIIE family protein phosphatase [Candidatus Omnitrophota bacterium]